MKIRFLLTYLCAILLTAGGLLQASNSTPMASRVYGDFFTPEISPMPSLGVIGTLDTTFGSNGNLSLNAIGTNATAYAVQALEDGTFVVLLGDSSNSYLAKYSATGVLDTTGFGGGTGYYTLTGLKSPGSSIVVDAQGRFVVCGSIGSGSKPWIARILPDGTTDSHWSWTDGTAWTTSGNINSVVQDASGNVIAVGRNNTYAKIAYYSPSGSLATGYGYLGSGYITFNGTGEPDSITPLNNAVIDAKGNLYTIYIQHGSGDYAQVIRFTSTGAQDITFNSGSATVPVTALNGATELQIALAADNSIIVAGKVSSNFIVTNITLSGGVVGAAESAVSTFTFNTSTIPTIGSDTFIIKQLLTTSDGHIFIIGYDTTAKNSCVIRLTSAGALDSANYNSAGAYPGLNEFLHGTSSSTSNGACIAPDGRLYVAGIASSGSVVPYISRLYNDLLVTQVSQYPTASEQGILDFSFGVTDTRHQSYQGVVSPIDGLYGAQLQQKATAVIELAYANAGDILVGANGMTNTSANSNMIFSWLNSVGVLTAPASGTSQVVLTSHDTNEYLKAIAEDYLGALYVAGSATSGAILRKYTSTGSETWYAAESTTGYIGTGLALQYYNVAGTAKSRVLLFVDNGDGTGHISGYAISGSGSHSLDSTFGSSGIIAATAYTGLHMGPIYAGAVNAAGNIFVAYKDTVSSTIKVAAFKPDGSGLISQFGTAGIFDFSTHLSAPSYVNGASLPYVKNSNIRMVLDPNQKIIVAAVDATGQIMQFARLDAQTGQYDASFGTSGIFTQTISASTALQLAKLTYVSNGTILATATNVAADDSMIVVRVTSAGALDTTFDTQGAGYENLSIPGILAIKIGDKTTNYAARVATSLCVQSQSGPEQGNLVLAGYESVTTSDATPMVMRIFGATGTTEIKDYPAASESLGGLNTTFQGAGYVDLYGLLNNLNGSVKAIYTYPAGNVYAGQMLVAIDTGSSIAIARFNATDMSLDATFGTSNSGFNYASISSTGITCLTVDGQNNVIVAGTTGGAAWAQQLSTLGASPVSFTIAGSGLTSIRQIYQQQSGRYIVVGSDGTHGLVVAFKDKGSPIVIDPSFNPLGTVGSGSTQGIYQVNATTDGIYSLAIDIDDTIIFGYKNSSSGHLEIVRLKADCFGVVGSTITTTITPDSSATVHVAFDNQTPANIVAAATCGTGANVQITRVTSTGTADSTWTGTGIVSGIQTISDMGSSIVLSSMMQTTTQQTILAGYSTVSATPNLFVSRLTSAGVEDAAWNSGASLTIHPDSIVTAFAASIEIDGNIFVGGGTNTTLTSSHPLLVNVVGDNYVNQLAEQPLESPSGLIDTTLNSELNGSASNAVSLSSLTGSAKKIYISPTDGSMFIATSNGTNSYVTKLHADFTAATFGTASVAAIYGKANISDMFVVSDGSLLVTGDNAGAMWAAKISADGSTVTQISVPTPVTGTTLTHGYAIRQTTNQRILVSGITSSGGVVTAFKSDLSGVDVTFGNAGYYTTSLSSPIYDMVVDQYNRIYIAYQAGGSQVDVQCLYQNGTGIDPTFSSANGVSIGGFSSLTSSSPIRLALDSTNKQLVVAVQNNGAVSGNTINVYRFSTVDGSAAGSVTSGITVASYIVTISDLLIDSNKDIYVIGSNNGSNKGLVARIKDVTGTPHTLALDNVSPTLYGTGGVAAVNLSSSMIAVNAGALSLDRRIYLVGDDGSNNPYIARVFGNSYYTQDQENIAIGVMGHTDLSLDGDDATPVGAIINPATLASGYAAQAVYTFQSGANFGKILIAFCDSSHVRVAQFSSDMQLDTVNFNHTGTNHGVTEVQAMNFVNNLTVDASGRILVCGTYSGEERVIRYTSAGVLDVTFSSFLALTVGTQIGQQKSGRYIVGSAIGGVGIINAYQNTGLTDDQSFGPAGYNGYYETSVATAQVDGLVIDGNDCIYIVYHAASNSHVYLEKVTANGSGLVPGFNSSTPGSGIGAAIDTGIVATGQAYIAIDATGTNLLVGATTSTGILTQAYVCATGATVGSRATVITDSGVILTDIISSGTGFVGSAWSTTSPASMSVFRINSSGALDTGFASTGVASVTRASFSPVVPTIMNGVTIQPDGRIIMVGSNGSNPVVIRLYGYLYTNLQNNSQAPNQSPAGTLDLTLPNQVSGAFEFSSENIANLLNLSGYTIKRVYESGNGIMTFVADDGSHDTTIFRLLNDLTLDQSFNSTGYLTFTGSHGNTTGLFINGNEIYITGTYSGASWVECITTQGLPTSPVFTAAANLKSGTIAMKQSSGRVILAGQGATDGMLVAYRHTGAVDTTFGTSGYVDNGLAVPIADMVIDTTNANLDRVWMLSVVSGSTVVKTVDHTGSSLTTCGGTAIAHVNGNNVAIAQDSTGNYIFVAAAVTTGLGALSAHPGFVIARYNMANGSTAGSQISFTTSSTSTLANIYATSDGKLTLVGTDGSNVVVARTMADFSSLDTTFNGGVAFNGSIGSPMTPYDAIIHADDRIMIVGGNGSNPYMGRLFGDAYVSYVSQAASNAVPGTMDKSWGINGLNDLYAPLGLAGIGKAIIGLSDGSSYLAIDNGSSASYGGRVLASGNVYGIPAFNSPYGYFIDPIGYGNQGVATTMDSNGNIIILGTNPSNNHLYIARYTSAGLLDTTFNSGSINGAPGYVIDSVLYGGHSSVVVDANNNIIIVASSSSASLTLARYTSAGILDTTFYTGVASPFVPGYVGDHHPTGNYGTAIAVDYQGNILVSTIYTSPQFRIYVARYTSAGALDTTFNGSSVSGNTGTPGYFVDPVGIAFGGVSMAIDANHNILITGYGPSGRIYLARYTSAGVLDTTFNNGSVNGAPGYVIDPNAQGNSGVPIVLDSHGNILVSGVGSGGHIYLARYTSAGILDNTFGPGTSGSRPGYITDAVGFNSYAGATSIALDSHGNILLSGNHSSDNHIYVARYTSAGALDTSFNSGSVYGAPGYVIDQTGYANYGTKLLVNAVDDTIVTGCNSGNYIYTAGYTPAGILNLIIIPILFAAAPQGVQSMFLDGLDRLVMVGTHAGAGWISRYVSGNSGAFDTTFNAGSVVSAIPHCTAATYAVEQTLGRIVIAGFDGTNGALFALTNAGVFDTTFNSTGADAAHGGTIPGKFSLNGIGNAIYAIVADQYDRLIIAYKNGTGVDLCRLTASGELDGTFGTGGIISGAIAHADDATSIRVALDVSGNIVVAAHISTGGNIAVAAFDNGIAPSGNGVVVYTEVDFDGGLTSSTLTNITATNDSFVLVGGNYSSGTWIARIAQISGAYNLDINFSPAGTTEGIFTYHDTAAATSNGDLYYDITIDTQGRLQAIGAEVVSSINHPAVIRLYDDPGCAEIIQAPASKVIGTNDATFGVSPSTVTESGITFYGASAMTYASAQAARAVAMQDNNNIVVAIDGSVDNSGTPSQIMLNMFDVDGLATSFGSHTISSGYQTTGNQHVRDMMTFTAAGGVHKAIVAGYVMNSTPSICNSLVTQYNLTTPGIDTSFGGYDSNPAGFATGDVQQACVVGRQTSGRIVVGGLDHTNNGVLVGYSSVGKLDATFGVSGLVSQGTTGIYSHVIDPYDNILVAYEAAGNVAVARFLADGVLDTSFGYASSGIIATGNMITGVTSASNLRVALQADGHVIVAAVVNSGHDIMIKRYAADGSSVVATLDLGATGTSLGNSSAVYTIAQLLIDANGKVIIVASDSNTHQNIIIRATATLSGLDATFNPDSSAGYVRYAVAGGLTQNVTDALIHNDGRIIIVGSEN